MLHQICSTKNPFDVRCESVTNLISSNNNIINYGSGLYEIIVVVIGYVKGTILTCTVSVLYQTNRYVFKYVYHQLQNIGGENFTS